jgi:hypothetical protein
MIKKTIVFRPLLLATLLAIGFGIVWGMIILWAVQVADEAYRRHRSFESLVFMQDGTPVVRTHVGNRYDAPQYQDLSGNRLDISATEERWLPAFPLPAAVSENKSSVVVAPWYYRIASFVDDRRPPVYWFFVTDGRSQGHAYWVGYDSLTNARIGFLGTAGFRADPLVPEELFPFSGSTWDDPSGWGLRDRVLGQQYSRGLQYPSAYFGPASSGDIPPWVVYVHADGNKLYEVDLSKRTAHVALPNVSIRSAWPVYQTTKSSELGTHRLAVRTDDEILLLDSHDQVTRRFQIPPELRNQDFNWSETSTGDVLLYQMNLPDRLSPVTDYQIYLCDATGVVKRHETAAIQRRDYWQSMPILLGVFEPSPLVTVAVTAIIRPGELVSTGRAKSYSAGLARGLSEFWPALLISLLAGGGLAWRCYRRQVLYAATGSQRVIWPVFVFLLGLPGWVGYRFGRSWPRLERCQNCGGVVPMDRTTCNACQVSFALPEPKGTEIFA